MNENDVLLWARAGAVNREQLKVSMSTKVCSSDFVRGHRTSECPTPTLYIGEYDSESMKALKTCSKDQIYCELVYEDDAFALVEVRSLLGSSDFNTCRW